MPPAIALPNVTSAQKLRGRVQLLLILAVVIGPMLLASAMYHWQFWVPQGRNYHGELIGTGQRLSDLGVDAVASGEPHWQLLVTVPQACDAACHKLVYIARQVHIGLNRDANRASHALANAQPLPAQYAEQLQREYPQLGRYALQLERFEKTAGKVDGAQLWIVDPLGNLVLRYGADSQGKAILDDLRLLLKVSQIG
jgi:hypothetical protein